MYIRKYMNPKFNCNDHYYDNDGISVLFIGGVHGNEINTIMAVGAIAKMPVPCSSIDPHIREVGFIPCANFEAFRVNCRGYVSDNTDLNRGWKDSNYRSQLESIIAEYDVVIDCHCSEDIAPLFYLSTSQPATDICAMIRCFEREYINYALSNNANDTIKVTHTMRPGFYHPLCGSYRKQLSITWEENGMEYRRDSVESTERMITEMLTHYAYVLYRDTLIQELIETPPTSEFRTLGFVHATKEGVFRCNLGSGCTYNYPLKKIEPNETIDLGVVRAFDIHGRYGDELSVCAEYMKSDVELRIFEISGRGRYVTEGVPIAAYQPSNADKFPKDQIENASHTYIPHEYYECGILQLSAEINKRQRQEG